MAATIMVVLGTRPEAVKMAPLIKALEAAEDFEPLVVVTGQHRQILDEVLELFEITPDHDLNLLRARQTLTHVTVSVLEGVGALIDEHHPAAVVVQGDTTTTFAASLAAFYRQVPVAHVEAGLRSGNRMSPYPEEINRQLTTRIADLHLCPTETSKANLLAEGVAPEAVLVTGNTVIDALQEVVARATELPTELADLLDDDSKRLVLVTAHRRESWGEGLTRIAGALRQVVQGRDDITVVFPIHPNPVVREAMLPALGDLANVRIVDPLPYETFSAVMARAHVIVTDSGGVQEEAPSLGVPVLVTRRNTERPEAVEAGTVLLVGDDPEVIVRELTTLLDDPAAHEAMRRAVNPYGDGHASARIVQSLRMLLDGAPAPEPFRPEPGSDSR